MKTFGQFANIADSRYEASWDDTDITRHVIRLLELLSQLNDTIQADDSASVVQRKLSWEVTLRDLVGFAVDAVLSTQNSAGHING